VHYSPGSGTPFGDKVDALRALAGGAKLSIDVLRVSSQGGDRKSAVSAKRASDLGRCPRGSAGSAQRSHLTAGTDLGWSHRAMDSPTR
jgi:hypothetical protein